MSLIDSFKKILSGGHDELGRDDLVRGTVDGICALKTYGARGAELFPPAVRVVVSVSAGTTNLIRSIVEDPSFDQEIETQVLNRMVVPLRPALSRRRYVIQESGRSRVDVEEDDAPSVGRLRVEGGDCDGRLLELPTLARDLRLGRGPWHGPDQRVRNDLVVAEGIAWVSRAAAVLRRSGPFLEVESRDQKEYLAVVRPDGTRVRPALAASGRCALRNGDHIELVDGQGASIRLHLEA